jgi:heat shock protein HtpX
MGVKIIDPHTSNAVERKLIDSVYSLAARAKLPKMPEVGIYDSPEVNAFATGPSKANSLVAVSTGLLHHMDAEAVDGVLGHEVAHIANGDMVTMTLIQGVINTMVLIVARVIAGVVAGNVEERSRPMVHLAVFFILQIVLSILGSMMVAYFSRRREFRADRGGAQIAGRDRMLSGLKSLRNVYGEVDDTHQELATLKISGHAGSFMALMSTHPPLEERIRRLETMPL